MPDRPQQIILFGHIPKTAGSTLKRVLWQAYGTEAVFFSMDPKHHAQRFADLAHSLETGAAQTKAVVTHAGFGIHSLLPAGPSYPYFTFLRAPIDRVLSNYYYFLQEGKIPQDTTLEGFVTTYLKPGCNMMTSYLSGYFLECHLAQQQPDPSAFNIDMLDKAKAHLREHAVIGLTEAFDVSLMLLQRRFGWRTRSLLYWKSNVGKKRPERPKISAQTMQVVEAQNALDLALYDYGKQLFAERVAEAGADLEARLRRFQSLNRVYATVAPKVRTVLRPAVQAVRSLRTTSS